MTKVIKVAKSGYDALTETDPNSFIFDSQYNTFKILVTGTHSASVAQSQFQLSGSDFVHNQSSPPFVLAFCKFEDDTIGLPGTKVTGVDFWFVDIYIDSTRVYFSYLNDTGSNYDVVIRYYFCEVPL